MPFELILFDLDDTLMDFSAAEDWSLEETLSSLGVDLQGLSNAGEDFRVSYKAHSAKLWAQVETGEVNKSVVKYERFVRASQDHNIELDGQLAGERYLEKLAERVFYCPFAEELCARLSKEIKLGIITNGIDYVQKRRLAKSSIKEHVDYMLVSEECGYPKPHPRMFEIALERSGVNDPSQVLMVGDRLESDVLGANNAGLKSCWYNPHKQKNHSSIEPNFEIRELRQVIEII